MKYFAGLLGASIALMSSAVMGAGWPPTGAGANPFASLSPWGGMPGGFSPFGGGINPLMGINPMTGFGASPMGGGFSPFGGSGANPWDSFSSFGSGSSFIPWGGNGLGNSWGNGMMPWNFANGVGGKNNTDSIGTLFLLNELAAQQKGGGLLSPLGGNPMPYGYAAPMLGVPPVPLPPPVPAPPAQLANPYQQLQQQQLQQQRPANGYGAVQAAPRTLSNIPPRPFSPFGTELVRPQVVPPVYVPPPAPAMPALQPLQPLSPAGQLVFPDGSRF